MDDAAYQPISCDFHDLLEAAATRRSVVVLELRDSTGETQRVQARIDDIVTQPDGEYVQLDTGLPVRLDRIVSIDGVRLADYPD